MTSDLAHVLPFPPSVNHYWQHVIMGKYVRMLISAAGREFKLNVAKVLQNQLGTKIDPILCDCRPYVSLHAPDRRRRNVDNYAKALLNSLTEAGVWADDSQIRDLSLVWGDMLPGGKAVVMVRQMPMPPAQGKLVV